MSAKHTPGPWMKAERLNGPWWHISSSHSVGGRQAVACVHGESKRGATAYAEMFEANARLIAAAPELLSFVKEWLDRQGSDENYMTTKARKAIFKATGEAT